MPNSNGQIEKDESFERAWYTLLGLPGENELGSRRMWMRDADWGERRYIQ